MPKVTGGLFSLKATKSLKKTITYQGKKGQNIVYKYHKPGDKNPFTPSDTQVAQRLAVKVLVKAWQALSDASKLLWETAAEQVRYVGTGYHYFMHLKGVGVIPPIPPVGDSMLQESGDYILQESGDRILLE